MKLLELRKEKKITQQAVADVLGISKQVYSRYERGDRKADYDTLCSLANFFEVTTDELLGRVPEQQLFDDARVPKTEEQEMFDSLTPQQQNYTKIYMQGFIDANAIKEQKNDYYKRA